MPPAVLFLAPLLALLLGAAVFATLRGRRHGSYPFRLAQALQPGEAMCGRCGYRVRPGSSTQCPECGQPHAEAGLLTPALAARFATRPGVLGLRTGFAVFILMLIVGSILSQTLTASGLLPQRWSTHATTTLRTAAPASQRLQQVHVDLRGTTSNASGTDRFVSGELRVSPDASPTTLVYRVQSDTWRLAGASGPGPNSGTGLESGVRAFYTDLGIDASQSPADAEAAELAQVLRQRLNTPNTTIAPHAAHAWQHWRLSGQGTSSTSTTVDWILSPALITSAAAGLAHAVHRRRQFKRLTGEPVPMLPPV